MGRRRAEPNYGLVFAVLNAAEREMVTRWVEELGAPPDAWHRIPPLRSLVCTLAILRLAARMDLPRGDAFAEACEALGLADDNDRATRPSDSFIRNLSRWLAAAHGGQSVRPRKADAA